jgi:hypothetical protein
VTNALQLTLTSPEDFQPVPVGTGHYVAALQTKKGEFDALITASAQTWAHLTPLIEIVGPRSPGADPFTKTRVEGWVKKVAAAVGVHPCFLDVLRLGPNHPTAMKDGNRPVLSVIHGAARKRNLAFVPVMRLGDAKATVNQIAGAAACDGRGVALRYSMLGTVDADGRGAESLVKEALDAVQVEINGADLLMDLGYLPEDAEIDPEFLAPMIDELVAIGPWRSVVLLGTSIPRSLGGGVVVPGSIGRLKRREWLLWSALSKSGMGRLPTYGDYAIQHPEPPMDIVEGQIPLGIRGAIRYTHETETVIPRAKAPRLEEGREQYRQLCELLVNQPEFAGRDFTWGDRQIAECAAGECEPGWEEHWRGAGTSHHLRHVVDQLAVFSPN